MKNVKQKLKRIFTAIGLGAVAILFVMIMGAAIHHENEQPITGFDVSTGNTVGNNFVDDSDIYDILRNAQYTAMIGQPVQNAELARLSALLNNNPYIKNANVYVAANGKIMIKVRQRTAILRVINNSGVSFYIDENGDKMPPSDKFTPRVEVATGLILDKDNPNDTSRDPLIGKLFFLTKKIQENTFMNALVQQIYVDDNHELQLIPSVGNFSILVGDTDRLEAKFADLQSLYKAHPNDFPWNSYTMLSLKYAHQVVGIRNSAAPAPVPLAADVQLQKPLDAGNNIPEKPVAKMKTDSLQVHPSGQKKTDAKPKHKKTKKKKKDSQ